ncbi:MAG: hypothetical protein ABFD75_12860 [Smithella sp.]
MQIAQIENELRIEAQQPCPKLSWLKDSYGAGREFWQSFQDAADEMFSVKTTSALFKRYTLYNDLILRNINNPSPAFVFYGSKSGFKNISYQELHERALVKTSLWKSRGVDDKKTVCVIRTIGAELMVELAAALQIGCRLAFLMPWGRSYLHKRLALLEPEFVSMEKKTTSLLSDAFREKILTEAGNENNIKNEKGGYYNYVSGRPVFAAFAPCTEKSPIINDINSDAVYLGALRDGLIALGLGPGRIYTAPGFHCLETYPGLFLAGLFCGATYLHLTPQDIKENPQIAVERKIDVFGVSRAVRDILMEKPVNADGVWRTWFRNPAESADMDTWHHFSRRINLLNSYSFNLRWDASAGGCNLFSIRRKGTAHAGVLPAFGSSWQLADLSDPSVESLSDLGILSILPPGVSIDGEKKPTGDMISIKGDEWLYLGVNYLNRDGSCYPVSEILDVLGKMIKDIYFSLVEVSQTASPGSSLIVLLAFYGDEKDFARERAADNIRQVIELEMGEEFQPDKIDFLPLYPRFLENGEPDHEWCRTAYLTGQLRKKAKDEVCINITRMRKYLIKRNVLTKK